MEVIELGDAAKCSHLQIVGNRKIFPGAADACVY